MAALRIQRWQIACLVAVAGAMSGCSSTPIRQDDTTVTGDASAGPLGQTIPAPNPPQDSVRARVVDTALSMVGTPYRYGGSSPAGFDCSGLVYFSYDAAGVSLPRTTTELLRASRGIALREAREGDLLFFEITSKPDHVGIFIGNGQFVHAPSTGKQVSIATLEDPFWRSSFVSARRLDQASGL